MTRLLRKELRLAVHPSNYIFLSLSAMLLIPSYPYYVIFFYTTLGLFFLCLNGRENHDIEYSMLLPIPKRAIVKARIGFAVVVELAQLLLCVPFMLLHTQLGLGSNDVGMDANLSFVALSLVLLGIFNISFFPQYYRNPNKIGKSYVLTSVWLFVYMGVAEGLTHVVPVFRDVLDTPDPLFLPAKLLVLAIGALTFLLLTFIATHISIQRFSQYDL